MTETNRPQGQLEKSLAALTIGVHQSAQERHRALIDAHAGEYEQQVHVPLAGQAGLGWNFTDKVVNWELPFVYAPTQRRVPFATPHFTHGIEFIEAPNDLVLITAHVVKWSISEEGWYTGATVRFACNGPNSPIKYSAIAHLSFQGYASPAEGDEFQ